MKSATESGIPSQRVPSHTSKRRNLEVGEVVAVYDEGHPRGLWRLERIEYLVLSSNGKVRGVNVRVMSKKCHIKILQRPIQHIYPLEVRTSSPDQSPESPTDPATPETP